MKIDDYVASRIGALMPQGGPSASEAMVTLYDNILRAASACTGAFIIYHSDEMPLLEGELVVQLQRVGQYERWKALHRNRMGKLQPLMRWDAIIVERD